MIVPLSWLKKYVDIKLSPKELGEKLTEVGLGCEKITETKDDVFLDFEITPNRPDCLSIIGVAREVAAITNREIKYPNLKTELKPLKNTQILPLIIHEDFTVTPRLTGIIINKITVKDSPVWLQEKLKSIGQRSINNIVDITNFVMKELGNPIHAFDYSKIKGNEMWESQAKGGEIFESVDEIKYHLPKGAIIYKDKEKIFDLVGIKGGKNSGTYSDTKTVFIVVEVDDPILIRKASLALGLRSDASAIFERNVNRGGTIDALKRTTDLILELAGGEIASKLIDIKKEEFKPWKLQLKLQRLEDILGIKIPEKEVVNILDRLNLSPKIEKNNILCAIPTYRNDLKIEEDLIEEVARIYGYNNFPKTMPIGEIPTTKIPYFKDYINEEKIKNYLTACKFSEIYSYSLVSETDLVENSISPEDCLRVDNSVSREFEYLRPTLLINLKKAVKQNKPNFPEINLFELGKVYKGKSLDTVEEIYCLSAVTNCKNYFQVKGIIEELFNNLGIKENPVDFIKVIDEGIFFEINIYKLQEKAKKTKFFIPLAKYPPITEDISITIADDIKTGEVIATIKKQSNLITEVTLLDTFENKKTFHIVYQDKEKNLTNKDIEKIREKIVSLYN